jgi:hypothetical protein
VKQDCHRSYHCQAMELVEVVQILAMEEAGEEAVEQKHQAA